MTMAEQTPEQAEQQARLAEIRANMRVTQLERSRRHDARKHTRHMIEIPTTREDLSYRLQMLSTR